MLYLKWITNKDLLYGKGNSVQRCAAAWMGGDFGGEWIHAYIWLSLSAVHLKLSQYCSSATKVKVLGAQWCPILFNLMDCSLPGSSWRIPSTAFSRQEYCRGLPFPSPGDLPNPGIEPGFPALQADSLPSEPPGKPPKLLVTQSCLTL